jgi:hypothetical protein
MAPDGSSVFSAAVAGRLMLVVGGVCLRAACDTSPGSVLAAVTAQAPDPRLAASLPAACRFVGFVRGMVEDLAGLPPHGVASFAAGSGAAGGGAGAEDAGAVGGGHAGGLGREAAADRLRTWMWDLGVPYMHALVTAATDPVDRSRCGRVCGASRCVAGS